jgi:beta-galactosidase
VPSFIHAFSFHDIPVSFVESYNGQFDEVFARRETGEVVGFIQHLGKGKVMVLGAAMPVHKLDELDIFRQMALKMDCQPLFELSDWADVRLSRGESGSFLFLNNYLDDPVETTVEYRNQVLFGGCSIHLPARRGLILPIEWRLNDDVLIHFVTTEIVDVCSDGMGLMLKAAQNEFVVELSASGYYCDKAEVVEATMPRQRLRFHGTDGILQLRRIE